MNKKVYFVGAGPGDPELITLKGKRLLEEADVVIYAGSLVPQKMLLWCKEEAILIDSSSMTLEEIISSIKTNWEGQRLVVRLHTGDPSLYGAINEQLRELDTLNIPYEIVPGVTAAFLCAARIKREFTVPEATQTLIITRAKGRTPVPETESIKRLSSIGASMAIYLSINDIDNIASKLSDAYGIDARIVVGYRLGWPDEKIIEGTLRDIAQKVKNAGITRHAVIIIGPSLCNLSQIKGSSRLYSKDFSHGYRN